MNDQKLTDYQHNEKASAFCNDAQVAALLLSTYT